MITLISDDRAANVIKYYALQALQRYLRDHQGLGNAYLCVFLAYQKCTVAEENQRHILALVNYIQQELPGGVNPPRQRSMNVHLFHLGLIKHTISPEARRIGNLARAAWVDRMLQQLEEALA